jgi:hypothetical protein
MNLAGHYFLLTNLITKALHDRESLLKGEGSVQLKQTDSDQLLLIVIYFLLYKTSYLNKNLNHTDLSPSVRVPRVQ